MGFFLGLLMVNSFLCNIEEIFEYNNRFLFFYKRYVDDILVIVNNIDVVEFFFCVLNDIYLLLEFIMEIVVDDSFFFLGMWVIKSGCVF